MFLFICGLLLLYTPVLDSLPKFTGNIYTIMIKRTIEEKHMYIAYKHVVVYISLCLIYMEV